MKDRIMIDYINSSIKKRIVICKMITYGKHKLVKNHKGDFPWHHTCMKI